MTFRIPARHGAMLAAALAAAACAGPGGDRFAAGAPSPGAAAVQAFADICAVLDGAEVARRAAPYGFLPVDARRLAAMGGGAFAGQPLTVLARPAGGAPALLVWAEHAAVCELGLGGVDTGEVERAFDAMVRALAAREDQAVTELPRPPDQSGQQVRVERAVLVMPRALVQGRPRVVSLRRNTDKAQPIQVALVAQAPATAVAATPQPSQGPPKR
ncbi:hypothetical protein [Crenalkalicoccus roseus]|uniref:hypothetical protein n=1 Tax=Crenalkalicoccus roseus TaxID=1485588 RepID=UPI0010815A5E|nr:hypothetical protein [Crenalkalicoccus roseus]